MTELDPIILLAAKAAHEVNRAYCAVLGDDSHPPWEDAPKWQRESACRGARAIANDPGTTPEQSHEGWLAQKRADGWVYGEAKNPEAKTHPCCVPYAELPAWQRYKDELFGATVRGVLSEAAATVRWKYSGAPADLDGPFLARGPCPACGIHRG